MKQLMLHKDREAYSIGMQPSMSWAAHLLECSFPFGHEARDASRSKSP